MTLGCDGKRSVIDTDEFYRKSCEAGYVKLAAVAKNVAWTTPTAWGDLQITVNLSKPEKDPRAIAAAAKQSIADAAYIDPATGRKRPCPLCVADEDVACGYAARIVAGGEPWALWYSPYAYYGEHCIAMSWQHRPMHVDGASFACLFDMVDQLPQYFFGSNADLPIVGGSILGHDHFQGGRHVFPMQKAPIAERFGLSGFPDVDAGVVKWPVTVIRLSGDSREHLIGAATHVLRAWVRYDDASVGIVSGFADGIPGNADSSGEAGALQEGNGANEPIAKVHNTITPILRKEGELYQLDLALRCNVTSEQHPLGVFHPHEELHHIKKENIGLIEVMGMAILPPRVQQVMADRGLSQNDVGNLFAQVLEHAGVFKWDSQGRKALQRFIACIA